MRYKNVSDYPQIVPEVGFFEAGEEKEVKEEINNPNFIRVSEAEKTETVKEENKVVEKPEVKEEVKSEETPIVNN